MVRPTKLIIDTESYIFTTEEMEGVYGIPRDIISIKNELQQVLHLVGKLRIVDGIKQNYTYKYSCGGKSYWTSSEAAAAAEQRKIVQVVVDSFCGGGEVRSIVNVDIDDNG